MSEEVLHIPVLFNPFTGTPTYKFKRLVLSGDTDGSNTTGDAITQSIGSYGAKIKKVVASGSAQTTFIIKEDTTVLMKVLVPANETVAVDVDDLYVSPGKTLTVSWSQGTAGEASIALIGVEFLE